MKKKIGLALGTGAARGLSQIGVIKVLSEAGIKVDFIAGTSVGAMVGAGLAVSGDVAEVESIALATNWKKLFSLVDLRVPIRGIIDGHRVEDFLRHCLGDAHFCHTKIPFSVTAADVFTAEKVVINEGSIAKAVRASISLPILFKPFHYNGRCLIDGATVDPIPVSLVRHMGADYVIAVNTYSDLKKYFEKKTYDPSGAGSGSVEIAGGAENSHIAGLPFHLFHRGTRTPSIIRSIVRSIGIMERHLAIPQLLDADLVISPDVSHIGSNDYMRARECIDLGAAAAREVLKQVSI